MKKLLMQIVRLVVITLLDSGTIGPAREGVKRMADKILDVAEECAASTETDVDDMTLAWIREVLKVPEYDT